jgi:acyl-coenzyme A thioesterase PaaI-like protein
MASELWLLATRFSSMLELPHTAGCVVCGKDNPHGLQLSLHVDQNSGVVTTRYLSRPQHIGFVGIIHGGVLATILDEAMVWAATWSGKRFCVCGELQVRYRQPAPVGATMLIEARVRAIRSRLIETTGTISSGDCTIYSTATGKYVPVPRDNNAQFVDTLIAEQSTSDTLHALRAGLR